MSWMERELKKRTVETVAGDSASLGGARGEPDVPTAAAQLAKLWDRIEAANNALPDALRLRRDVRAPGAFVGGMPAFPVALVANNLACLGRAAEGIRYLWPEKVTGPSRNFWIRWKPSKGFVVERRVSASPSNPVLAEQAFDEDSVEHMIKCLVTGARIKPASLLPGKILFIWSRR